ncbi:MAG: glycosyltransferase family 2 protein [Parvularculaceae bacterium]
MAFLVITLALIASFLGLLLALFLTLEVTASLAGAPLRRSGEAGAVAVVIPAHNEASAITATLANVRAQLKSGDRMLVVADNCSDDTAAVARANGADVIERTDAAHRGKGYALQFALDHLRAAPPEIVVFLDADCLFAEGALKRLAGLAAREKRPAQALYLMQAPAGAGPRLKVAEFAWLFINNVRMRGLQQIFGVTRFTGAGFAAPWRHVEDIDLASGEIVEDLAFTFDLIRKKAPPMLVHDAVVTSEFPADDAALARQSARWSIGSLRFASRASLAAFFEGLVKGNLALAAAAVDLMIPPLTIFIAALLAVLAFSLLAWIIVGASEPFWFSFWALVLTFASVAIGWLRYGRDALPPSEFGGLARFLMSKLDVFSAKGRASAKTWTPTRGGDETERS